MDSRAIFGMDIGFYIGSILWLLVKYSDQSSCDVGSLQNQVFCPLLCRSVARGYMLWDVKVFAYHKHSRQTCPLIART